MFYRGASNIIPSYIFFHLNFLMLFHENTILRKIYQQADIAWSVKDHVPLPSVAPILNVDA